MIGPEAALPVREEMTESGALELQARDRLQVSRDQTEADV
jgi:hypothetical protein